MKPFLTLTVCGQARRLRQLAINALSSYDLDVARFRLIMKDVNGIFRIDTADGRKNILRVTAPEGGHIRQGKSASLLLVRGNPLEDVGNAQQIEAVLLRGQYFNRKDLDRLLDKARELARDPIPGKNAQAGEPIFFE
jgi:hypothetical protein